MHFGINREELRNNFTKRIKTGNLDYCLAKAKPRSMRIFRTKLYWETKRETMEMLCTVRIYETKSGVQSYYGGDWKWAKNTHHFFLRLLRHGRRKRTADIGNTTCWDRTKESCFPQTTRSVQSGNATNVTNTKWKTFNHFQICMWNIKHSSTSSRVHTLRE